MICSKCWAGFCKDGLTKSLQEKWTGILALASQNKLELFEINVVFWLSKKRLQSQFLCDFELKFRIEKI